MYARYAVQWYPDESFTMYNVVHYTPRNEEYAHDTDNNNNACILV